MKEDTPQWIIICMMKALSLLGVIMIILMMIAIMTAPLHCQCVDTQYVAPSGKVVRETHHCDKWPLFNGTPESSAEIRRLMAQGVGGIVTITLKKGCPTCGSMKRIDVPGLMVVPDTLVYWLPASGGKPTSITRTKQEYSACRSCGTVYRGRP